MPLAERWSLRTGGRHEPYPIGACRTRRTNEDGTGADAPGDVAGTALMPRASAIEMKFQGREPSSAPVDAAGVLPAVTAPSPPPSPVAPPGAAAESPRIVSDPMLVTAVCRGHQPALAELYRRHAGSLFSMAFRVLRRRELAEEVVQGVFTRLWTRPELYDPTRGALRSYLLTQAHSRAVDLVRVELARRAREQRHATATPPTYEFEEEVLNLQVGQDLRQALEDLSEVERTAIELAYFGAHTYRDVARLLGVPEGTVKSRIRAGLGRLRSALVTADSNGSSVAAS